MIAIAYAVASGVLFGVNALIMRHYVREVGFSALQLNVDGFMVCAVVLTCCFVVTDTHYTMFDVAEGIFCSFVSMGGTVSLSKALNCGKGGPI